MPEGAIVFPPPPVQLPAQSEAHTRNGMLAAHIRPGETQEACWRRVSRPLRAALRRARSERHAQPFGEQPALVRDARRMGAQVAEASGFFHPRSLGHFPELRSGATSLPPLPIAAPSAQLACGARVVRANYKAIPVAPPAGLAGGVATSLQRAGFSHASEAGINVLCDVLGSFLESFGSTLRRRCDEATGTAEARAEARVPLVPLRLLSRTLDDLGVSVTLESLQRYLQHEEKVRAAARDHVAAYIERRRQRGEPAVDEQKLFDQTLLQAFRTIPFKAITVREQLAIVSTQSDQYANDPHMRTLVTDYGMFGKRRKVASQYWYGDDALMAPPPNWNT